MKFKLKRIDWYIIKQFLGTYIFAIALITLSRRLRYK